MKPNWGVHSRFPRVETLRKPSTGLKLDVFGEIEGIVSVVETLRKPSTGLKRGFPESSVDDAVSRHSENPARD